MKKRLSCLVTGILMIFIWGSTLHAIGIRSGGQIYHIKEAALVTGSVKIYTKSDQIQVNLYHLSVNSLGRQIRVDSAEKVSWIKVPKKVSKTDPSLDYIDVPYEIFIQKASRSEYICNLRFLDVGEFASAAVNLPIYVSFESNLSFGVEIEKVDVVDQQLFIHFLNEGNVHVQPVINATIYKKEGFLFFEELKKVYSGEVSKGVPIFGHSTRILTKRIGSLEPGNYVAHFSMYFGELHGRKFEKKLKKNFHIPDQ